MPGAADRVDDDEILLRGLLPDWLTTGENGLPRISSAAFKDRTDGLSLYRRSMTTLEQASELTRKHAFAEIRARDLRQAGGQIEVDPQDPSHVLVTFPELGSTRKTKAARDLAKLAGIVRPGQPVGDR